MNEFILNDGMMFENEETPSNLKSKFAEEDQTILNSFKPKQSSIDFKLFLNHAQKDDIFIFPFLNKLYLIIQSKAKLIEEKGKLKWNEISSYGNLIEHNDDMILKIDEKNELHILIKSYLNSFCLYEIPFYFIPIVKETYIEKYGENKGNWRIFIHPNVNINKNKFSFPLTQKYKLRDYQASSISAWRENEYFGTISIATAGGKTLIGIDAIKELHENTLIAVPTEPLLLQWKAEIEKYLGLDNNQVGLFYGKVKQLKPILIGTYTSLMKYIVFSEKDKDLIKSLEISNDEKQKRILDRERIRDFLQNYYSLLILDEAHHIPAPLFRQLALNSKAIDRLSLSATVKRFDGNERMLFFSTGKLIYYLSYLQLCELKWVIPFLYSYVPVQLTEDQIDYYHTLGQDLEKKKAISFFNTQKLVKILKIVQTHVNEFNHSIIIFVTYVESAFMIYDELKDCGIKCDLILSEINQKRKSKFLRNDVITQFKQKEINVIISTTVLDEGFNVPEANVAIITSGSSTDRQLIQRIGRIVRKSEDPSKIGYIYEITTEGDDSFLTLDQMNRLIRNHMIIDISKFNKERIVLESDLWTFDYQLINSYAKALCLEHKIKPIEFDF
jgi:superfamily II DNA or RNA helicase